MHISFLFSSHKATPLYDNSSCMEVQSINLLEEISSSVDKSWKKHLVPLVPVTAAKSKQFHLTEVFVDHMHVLYLGAMPAGTDDRGGSVAVPVFARHTCLFAQGFPSTVLPRFSVSCPYLIALKLSRHLLTHCLKLLRKAQRKCIPSTFFLSGKDRATTQCVFNNVSTGLVSQWWILYELPQQTKDI